MSKSVSILTPTTDSRRPFLQFVADGIRKQDYKNICEWIIIDGTRTGASNVRKTVEEMDRDGLPDIVLILQNTDRNNNIGALRNRLNATAKGDIMIYFDDDDYNFPTRVSHSVQSLETTGKEIAGCTRMLMYDNDFDSLFMFRGFGPSHALACTMAFTRSYLEQHRFDENVTVTEEPSFNAHHSEPMAQLDTAQTIICTSHSINTVSKRMLIWDNMSVVEPCRSMNKLQETIYEVCTDRLYLERYLKLLGGVGRPHSKYDIVYYCGLLTWDPRDRSLGGSEQAVVLLAKEWVKMGLKVAVYGGFQHECILDGVEYIHCYKFSVKPKYNILILWREHGMFPVVHFDLDVQHLCIDFHDPLKHSLYLVQMFVDPNSGKELERSGNSTKLFFKSQYHLDSALKNIEDTQDQEVVRDASIIIPNGIRKQEFINDSGIVRERHRFCYCNCYTRGLYELLKYFWPTLKEAIPDAELHVYYGMDMISDQEFKNSITKLLGSPGVKDHGRQPVDVIKLEKFKSNFHLYYTDSFREIDCISIKESAFAGCIPILSNLALFNSRAGIHLDGDPKNPEDQKRGAKYIVDLLKNDKAIEELRRGIRESKTLQGWDEISLEWTRQWRPFTNIQETDNTHQTGKPIESYLFNHTVSS